MTREGVFKTFPNVGEWWQDILTTNEIKKIRASQEAEKAAIESQDALNKQIMALNERVFGLQSSVIGDVRSMISASPTGKVPQAFDDMVALFEAGGEFGEGAKAEIEQGAQESLAAGQIGLASTGMSSGTNAAGLSARVASDAALSKAVVEDQRVLGLAGALETKGTATLSAQSLAQQQQASQLAALTALKPNFLAD